MTPFPCACRGPELDRKTLAAASPRAPELVLLLWATLAGWFARERPTSSIPADNYERRWIVPARDAPR